MTKVGKSDGEGTFAGTRGNDKVAPISDLLGLPPGTGSFDHHTVMGVLVTSTGPQLSISFALLLLQARTAAAYRRSLGSGNFGSNGNV